ncbi:MAG: TauD/TfdA family dioxygenase [Chromatiales bacterium]|jgi:taurine dioxygenase|nr:TauD/TfdA family dioxygenase [Chromatiales bacterium]
MINTAAVTVEPSAATLGASVDGIDLNQPLGPHLINTITDLWAQHLVLVFREQTMDEAGLLQFARALGDLDPPGPNPYRKGPVYPEFPELNVISNIVEGGEPIGNLGDGEAVWHADMTYQDVPPKGAILQAVELPPAGGNTQFANMYAAYDALDGDLRRAINGKVAIHDASHNSAGILRRGYEPITDVRDTPGARQPLVRTDQESGRRCLFLGRRPRSYVLGMEVAESDTLLDSLWAHATQPEFVYTHEWHAGDVLMWDNLALLHRRDAFAPDTRRRLHRAQLRGQGTVL